MTIFATRAGLIDAPSSEAAEKTATDILTPQKITVREWRCSYCLTDDHESAYCPVEACGTCGIHREECYC